MSFIKIAFLEFTVLISANYRAAAADLTWDHNADGTASDGAGTWLNAYQWLDGTTPATWNNTTPDNAIIGSGGTGGTITLGTVTAGTVLIDNFTGTYELANAGSLSQSGGITIGTTAGRVNLYVPISGAGGVTINGTSLISLQNGAKTFTGDLVINAGEVLEFNMAIGTGNLTLNGGVLVDYWSGTMSRTLGAGSGQVQILGGQSGFCGQGTTGLTIKFNNNTAYEVVWGSTYFNPSTLVLQSPGANLGGNLTWQNPLDFNGAPRTIIVNKDHEGTTGGGATISGVIRNSDAVNPSGLTKTGPGTLKLTSGGNTYNGPTIIDGGTVLFGNDWNGADTLPGGPNGSGSNLEIKNGNARLAYGLTRGLGTGPGDWQITGGTSGFSFTQADAYGKICVSNNANVEVVWGSTFFNPAVFVMNEAIAVPNQSVNLWNKLDLNGVARTIACNSTLPVSANYINANNGYMLTTGGRLTGVVRNSGGTPAGILKTGPGVLQLSEANTYDGGTTISNGTVQFTQTTAMPATGDVTVQTGATLAVNVGGTGEWTTGTSGNGTVGGLLAGLGGQSGGTVSYTGNVGLEVVVLSGSQEYSSAIADVGTSLQIAKSGSGTLTLSGNNSFNGGTLVSLGTLLLSGSNTGTGANTISGGTLSINADENLGAAAATIVLNGGTLQVTGTTLTSFGTRTTTFTSGKTVTLDIADASNTFTANKVLNQGSGGLVKNGEGALVLNQVNTYTGTTTANRGMLIAGANAPSNANGAFGKATSDVNLGVANSTNDAGILISGAFNVARNIRNATADTADTGTRVLTLGGNTADTSIFSGAVYLGTSGRTSKGLTLTAATGGQVTFSGAIQETGGTRTADEINAATALDAVTKVGNGTVVLSGSNSYLGRTVVSEGVLDVRVASSLGTSSGIRIDYNTATLRLENADNSGSPWNLSALLALNANVSAGTDGPASDLRFTVNGDYTDITAREVAGGTVIIFR